MTSYETFLHYELNEPYFPLLFINKERILERLQHEEDLWSSFISVNQNKNIIQITK